MSGKNLRLKRFMPFPDGRMVIFPLDHGVSCGPLPGLQRMEGVIRMGIRAGCDGLVLHKGMMSYLESLPERPPGVFMHLSASTPFGPSYHHKVMTGVVEEAIRRGADGVSVQLNLGDEHESEMLRDLGTLGSACCKWQFPLLVMVYVRGSHAPSPVPDSALAHAARVAAELGADIIKLPFPRDEASLTEITAGLPVPVVVAGGSKMPDTVGFLEKTEGAL
jgi:DhnA family fructose-bisphosphate aldolase class Ia